MLESEKVKSQKNKQIVIANLGPTWDGRIWILGMLLILNPHLIHSPDLLCDILLNYWIIHQNPPNKCIKSPIYPS